MRLLSVLLCCLLAGPSVGQWGRYCPPTVVGPAFGPPVIYHPPIIHQPWPPPGVVVSSPVVSTPAPAKPAKKETGEKPETDPVLDLVRRLKAKQAREAEEAKRAGLLAGDNFGVDMGKISASPKYEICGKKVCKQQAIAAASGLPDDAALPWITVIGPEAERKAALAALKADPEVMRHFRVKAYAPDAWQVQGVGFVTTGKPTVYVQGPDGKVLYRQDHFVGGLDAIRGALRKANPDYRPEADPGPNNGGDGLKPLLDFAGKVPAWAWALAAVGAFLFLRRDKKDGE